ncbi:mannitol-1-phosphate 5-dehydrogenase [Gemella sp. GH3]|uniref:mannitol-1-phosphate 5-dehydrogenase n=1 Tax=unclassified Gemella TaxID=2624949 RepID=UPI0015D06496|nr:MULTISPECIES: mannitol-1-phosphate 5-dehydrogenase [unclassified Gemella]MBF0713746.1 mannitol-1-phosphate 5-dehydrogenase [Gemella sp. GH3.1]NYS50698.1 mannitol-1-phosphate 5-dehydrogenase [Gemella sp. GH3]
MKNLHFGAGNIGRGFIGELLNKSNYHVTFVDINESIVNNLKERQNYTIKVLDENIEEISINNFDAINISTEKERLTNYINEVNLITTSIGPNVLPIIAKDIAQGLKLKVKSNNTNLLDIIACENMIEGTTFLKNEIFNHLTEVEKDFINKYVGFPNSAVDRIVPAQQHEDVLLVEVEKFCEWVIEKDKIKFKDNQNIDGVTYVSDLAPFIERKLFTVNTGHAALSYVANYKGLKLVSQGAINEEVREHFINVLKETSELLIKKWNFSKEDMDLYREKTIKRFENKLIVDDVARICRTPIRKLGYNERFIKPIRECEELCISYNSLAKTCAYILKFKDSNDEQAVKLQQLLKEKTIKEVIAEVTEYNNDNLLNIVENSYNNL